MLALRRWRSNLCPALLYCFLPSSGQRTLSRFVEKLFLLPAHYSTAIINLIFYDDEKIIFALSRKDHREFRWDELQNAKTNIFYPSSPAAWYFYFQDEKKTKKIAVTPRLAGYNEFVDMLRKKGFPAQSPSALNFDKNTAKDIFHEVFGQDFGKSSKNENK